MARHPEMETPDHTSVVLACDCQNGDYLRLSWDEVDPKWRYLWIEQHHRPIGWQRVKSAWSAIRGKSYQQTEVILNERAVAELKAFFSEASS